MDSVIITMKCLFFTSLARDVCQDCSHGYSVFSRQVYIEHRLWYESFPCSRHLEKRAVVENVKRSCFPCCFLLEHVAFLDQIYRIRWRGDRRTWFSRAVSRTCSTPRNSLPSQRKKTLSLVFLGRATSRNLSIYSS